jgi:uncharacterized protein (TIGR03435 family)
MVLMGKAFALAILAGFGSIASGQQVEKLSFDVASIKPSAPMGSGPMVIAPKKGGPGTDDPGRITWNNATLANLLMTAYDVKRYQITGPDWLNTERFDVAVTVPAGVTKEQVNVMWQNLLAERWGVALHRESKVFQLDELVVAKGGAKLKETELDAEAQKAPLAPPPPDGPKFDKNGFPQLPGAGLIMMMSMSPKGANSRMVGRAQSMEQLASLLGNQLNHPVVDKTALTGKYDFTLEFEPDPQFFRGPAGMMPPPGGPPPPGAEGAHPEANDPSGMPLPGALQQQLGLRLQPAKAPLDVLIIDRANKVPTEN